MDGFDNEVFRELCRLNSIAVSYSDDCYNLIKRIHLFFCGFTQFLTMQRFVNLKELVIIGQSISELTHLHNCQNLEVLWVCECGLRSMKDLEGCKKLRELFLFDNSIEKIEGLRELTSLRRLWLNDNQISQLSNLRSLRKLSELNVSGNRIQRIGRELIHNSELTHLYLSGNRWYDLHDMLILSNLPLLRNLNLNDCEYEPNPLSSLYLIPLIVFHQIPNLELFDGLDAGCANLLAFLDSLIGNKKLYYFHSYRCQVNKLIHVESNLRDVRRALLTPVTSSIRNLDNELRSLKAAPNFLHNNPESFDQEAFDKKVELLKSRIQSWKRQMATINLEFSQCISELHTHRLLRRCLLACELQMVGGLSFVEGSQSDPWFKMCEKFCLSRFCPHDPSFRHFSGLHLKSIYRVFNTVLLEHTGFSQLNEDDGDPEEDLLFYCGEFSSSSSLCKLATFVRSGFSVSDDSSKIILTSLLNCAITHCPEGSVKSDFGAGKGVQFFRGLLVRCRADSFWPESSTELLLSEDVPSTEMNLSAKELACACRQSHMKYELDNEFALYPEFVIEIEFIRKTHSLFHFAGDLTAPTPPLSFEDIDKFFESELSNDRSVLQLPPERPTPPNLTNTTLDDALEHPWFAKSLPKSRSDIREINFHGTRVSFLAQLSSLQSLYSLVLSNCGLSNLDAVSGLNLRHLDVSHNKISSLANMKDMPSLLTLDINWNKFSVLEKELKHISKHVKNLVTLNLQFNPWIRDLDFHSRVRSILPKLKFVDETHLKAVARKPGFSIDTFRSEELFSDSADYSLSLWPVNFFPSRYRNCSDCLPTKAVISRIKYLDNRIYTFIPFAESSFNRLVCLSVNNSYLSELSSLSSLTNLEELSIENNCLTSLAGIHHLYGLRSLLAGGNFISTLAGCGLQFLKRLEILALDDNQLRCVDAIDRCISLKHLYLSHNNISLFRPLLLLRDIPDLAVLDLSFNPIVTSLANYRSRIIFHLQSLVVLDGTVVQPSEVTQARDLLEGKLTPEYLIEFFEHDHFSKITYIDFENRGLRIVDLNPPGAFAKLHTINLDGNNLTSFSGLLFLKGVQVLCLNRNKVESLFPRYGTSSGESDEFEKLRRSSSCILPKLKVLYLAKNGIRSLRSLQLHRMPSIRTLFLQGNELTTVENLDGLVELRDLVLDDNRIRKFSEASFPSNWNLQEVHIEGNRLKELHHISHLCKLQRLFVGRNKLDSLENLDTVFTHLKSLKHISMLDNPITKKNLHRIILCARIPSIECIDGTPVTELEKQIAMEVYAESGLLLGPDAQSVSCPDISTMNSSRTVATSRAPNCDVLNVKCQLAKVDFFPRVSTKPCDAPQSKPNSVRNRGDTATERTEIRPAQPSRVSKCGAALTENTYRSDFQQDISLVFDLFSRLSTKCPNPIVDSNTSNKQPARGGTVPVTSTTVQASQLPDAEVYEAAGDLVYAYYVHDLAPKHIPGFHTTGGGQAHISNA
ncbi:unnamed protein product [Schistocephalus solidus]|uniref:Leucine-rich repeat-containing protein 9 n=1 Tax=Schistocephalus solidus TaxID=70667 RepID=A0A183SZG7_SCHSO|nr:unnamed protein product [Schistocephalus solidus]